MAKRKKTKAVMANLVDEYGKRDTLVKSLKKEMNELRAVFLEELVLYKVGPKDQLPVEGQLYDLLISKESTEYAVNDVKEVFDKLTREQFFECCTVNVTALRKLVPEKEFKALTKENKGSRKVTVKPKAVAAPKVSEVLNEKATPTKGGG